MEEDRVHLTIYPEGRTEPLFELYLSDDIDVINETMVYNAIRSHLTAKFGLLAHLMPAQEETLYLTLEQVEQLFGTDLSGLADFRLGAWDRRVNAKECFLLLAVMSREKQKDGYRFTLDIGQADICIARDGGRVCSVPQSGWLRGNSVPQSSSTSASKSAAGLERGA